MKPTLKAAVFALGGFAAGWVASSGRVGTVEKPAGPERAGADMISKSAPRKAAGRSARMDVSACRAVLAAADDDRHPLLRRFEREQAIRRWLELDPAGALAEAAKDPTAGFAKELFSAWAVLDPRAALDALNAASRELAGAVARDFFVSLMNHDPALAAEELARPKWKKDQWDWLGGKFLPDLGRQWFLADPEAAIASLGPPGSKDSLSPAEQAMAMAWAEKDFPEAWAHFAANGFGESGFSESDAMRLLSRGLLGDHPKALEIEAGSLELSVDLLADEMVGSNPLRALEWAAARAKGDPLRSAIELLGTVALASSDPEAFMEKYQALVRSGGPEGDGELLRESFAALAADDPVDAAARVMEIPERDRVHAMDGVLTRAFAADPAAAEAQVQLWLGDPAMKAAAEKAWALSFSWSHGSGGRDPGPMLEAIPELNDAVDAYVLSTWTKVDPEAAAGWIQERLEQGKAVKFKGDHGDEGILTDLAISQPEFTASWLLELPDAAVQAKAADTLAANWSAFDPAAADAWIASLPAGPVREAAEKGRVSSKAGKDRSDPFSQ